MLLYYILFVVWKTIDDRLSACLINLIRDINRVSLCINHTASVGLFYILNLNLYKEGWKAGQRASLEMEISLQKTFQLDLEARYS